jgi:hypothetical protein
MARPGNRRGGPFVTSSGYVNCFTSENRDRLRVLPADGRQRCDYQPIRYKTTEQVPGWQLFEPCCCRCLSWSRFQARSSAISNGRPMRRGRNLSTPVTHRRRMRSITRTSRLRSRPSTALRSARGEHEREGLAGYSETVCTTLLTGRELATGSFISLTSISSYSGKVSSGVLAFICTTL